MLSIHVFLVDKFTVGRRAHILRDIQIRAALGGGVGCPPLAQPYGTMGTGARILGDVNTASIHGTIFCPLVNVAPIPGHALATLGVILYLRI